MTKLAASLCRDAGEGGVASFVEVAGAAAAVLVSPAPAEDGAAVGHGTAVRRWVLLVVLAAVLLMPTALALDQEEILQDQSQSLGIEDLEEAGEAYTGQHDIEDGLDVGASFRHMAETGKEALGGVVKRSVRSCVLLLAVTLLCGLTEGVKAGTGGSGLG